MGTQYNSFEAVLLNYDRVPLLTHYSKSNFTSMAPGPTVHRVTHGVSRGTWWGWLLWPMGVPKWSTAGLGDTP
jgi:hypothetical protein